MISSLRGKVLEKVPPSLVIDVQGVGYEVFASMTTFSKLPTLGEEVTLQTHLVVREDAHVLYGFYSALERQLFRQLIKVNGIGPKIALAMLSGMDVATFVQTIEMGDVQNLTRIPGVGKKTAERLVIELRDKLSESGATLPVSEQVNTEGAGTMPKHEAISALVALGFKPQDASKRITKIFEDGMSSELLIRKALQKTA